MYFIQIEDQEGKIQFVGGNTEGTRYSIVSRLQSAKFFDSKEAAEEVFKDPEWTKRIEYTDGTSAPPHLIWSGLGICNMRGKGKGKVSILKMVLWPQGSFEIEDQLLP